MLKKMIGLVVVFSFGIAACESEPEPMPPQEDPEEMPTDDQQMGQAPQASDVSDEELRQFVEANIEAEAQQINPQADPEGLQEVIEETGLDMQRFEEINFAVRQDPQLQQELQQIFQEYQNEQQGF